MGELKNRQNKQEITLGRVIPTMTFQSFAFMPFYAMGRSILPWSWVLWSLILLLGRVFVVVFVVMFCVCVLLAVYSVLCVCGYVVWLRVVC